MNRANRHLIRVTRYQADAGCDREHVGSLSNLAHPGFRVGETPMPLFLVA